MKNHKIIKIGNETIDLSKIRSGIRRKDIEYLGNNALLSIFDCIDKEDHNGLKNKILDNEEINDFVNELIEFAKNTHLAKKETKKFLDKHRLNDVKNQDLFVLINAFIDKSKYILALTKNDDDSITIEYKEGYIDTIYQNGSSRIDRKITKDRTLKYNSDFKSKYNIPFYLSESENFKNSSIKRNLKEGSLRISYLNKILERNGYNKNNIKVEPCTYTNGEGEKYIYFDKSGQIIATMNCLIDQDGNKKVLSFEYMENKRWIQKSFSDHSITTIVQNDDKSQILNKCICSNIESFIHIDNYISPSLESYITTIYNKGNKSTEVIHGNSEEILCYKSYGANDEQTVLTIIEDNGDKSIERKYDTNNKFIGAVVMISQEQQFASRSFKQYIKAAYDKQGKLIGNDERFDDYISIEIDADVIRNYTELLKHNENQTSAILYEIENLIYDKKSSSANSDAIRNENIDNKGCQYIEESEYIPDNVIDKVTYQGNIGDCWLLSPTNAISEVPVLGKEYIESLIERDNEGYPVINLMDGKIKYTITPKEYNEYSNGSTGDPTLRLFEIALEKYAHEYGIDDIYENGIKRNIIGGKSEWAFSIYSGNSTTEAIRQNGKLGVIINDKFIEINSDNADKLKHIPITIHNIMKNDFQTLASIQKRTAMCTGIEHDHECYLKTINENSIQVKEPHNTSNIATYENDDFLNIYNNITIFIL